MSVPHSDITAGCSRCNELIPKAGGGRVRYTLMCQTLPILRVLPMKMSRAIGWTFLLVSIAAGWIARGDQASRAERKAFEATLPGSHIRAGQPHSVAPLAKPTYTREYEAGYIGGGVPTWGRGRSPTVHEGTWGRDYVGNRFMRQVWLRWSDGTRHQSGGGKYETDGPKLFE